MFYFKLKISRKFSKYCESLFVKTKGRQGDQIQTEMFLIDLGQKIILLYKINIFNISQI